MVGSSRTKSQDLAPCILGICSAANCTDVITHTTHRGQNPSESLPWCLGNLMEKGQAETRSELQGNPKTYFCKREKDDMLYGEKAKERKPIATSFPLPSIPCFCLQCTLQPKFLALAPLQEPNGHQQFRKSHGPGDQDGAFYENSPCPLLV